MMCLRVVQPKSFLYNMRSEEDPLGGVNWLRRFNSCAARARGSGISRTSQSLSSKNECGARRSIVTGLECRDHSIYSPPRSEVCMAKPLNQASLEAAEPETMLSVWMPKSRLIVFGGGNDAEAICKIARMIDFHVILADWRDFRIRRLVILAFRS